MQNRKGISLIVLVITIIVMIILAAAVVISLNNSGIINRADEAVNLTNEQQVQDLASLIWADAYMANLRGEELVKEVKEKLADNDVTANDWDIEITDKGVTVTEKGPYSGPTLGSLVESAADYGKTVDYSVTVDGTTYTDWQVYYEDETNGYVFLVLTSSVRHTSNENKTAASLTTEELNLYKIFKLGEEGCALSEESGDYSSGEFISATISNYGEYANTATYGSNVVGAIGSPTIELLVAGWNAKDYSPVITITNETEGYRINGSTSVTGLTIDGLYLSTYNYSLASHTNSAAAFWVGGSETCIVGDGAGVPKNIRPIVCLKATTPAAVGTTTDFSLVK